MSDLSVLIPARNEEFLARTIQDILEHSKADTEVIAVLDGKWADPPVEDHPKVTLVYHPESIGQRAATNEAAKIATSKYVMKVDAHCAFDDGFDEKMLAVMQDDWTMVPIMRNLHAFDWVCPKGHRRYQGPSGPCLECGEPTEKDVVWIAKPSPQSTAYLFDPEPHFQYFGQLKKRPEGKGPLSETMSLQGSCWMLTRDKFFDLEVCDESWGSWGSQGIEVACKTWLSGGRVICNHDTWYAHMFRTQGGDFSFPYPLSGKQTRDAKRTAHRIFFVEGWDKQTRPLSWLVEKFWPVPGWTEKDLKAIKDGQEYASNNGNSKRSDSPAKTGNTGTKAARRDTRTKGIVWYTDGRLDPLIQQVCQDQLVDAIGDIPLITVTPDDVGGQPGILTMHRQILAGLQALETNVAFLAEHDILYHPSHFDFTPRRDKVFYYNTNVWRWKYPTGPAVWTDDLQQLSGLVAYRSLLIDYFSRKIAQIEDKGNNRHYEPGTNANIYGHHSKGRYGSRNYLSEFPNVDIRHGNNLTPSKWSPREFRNKKYAKGWKETDEIPYWGRVGELFRKESEFV